MSVYQCVYEFMSVYQYVCLYVCLLKVADIDVHTHNVYRLLLAYDGATSGSRLKQIYVQKWFIPKTKSTLLQGVTGFDSL